MSSTVEEATTGLERMEQAVRAARDARAALEKDLESVKAEIQALTALQARIQASLDATLAFTSSGPSQPTTAGPEETEPTKAVAQEDTPPESTTPQGTPTGIGTPSQAEQATATLREWALQTRTAAADRPTTRMHPPTPQMQAQT